MANNNQNDIVINAKANTKEAEANLKKLEAQIQGMAKGSQPIEKLNSSLKKTGSTVKQAGLDIKSMGENFGALSGSLGGAVTKLGLLGLAVAGVRVAMQKADQAQKEYIENLEKAGKASEGLIGAKRGIADNALSTLEEFDKLAQNGNLDAAAIQEELNLVNKIREQWGDVGISIDKATGKVSGLQAATEKIEEANRMKLLSPLQKQLTAAEERLTKAQNALATEEAKQSTSYSNNWANPVSTLGNAANAVTNGLLQWRDPTELFDEYQGKAATGRLEGFRADVSKAKEEVFKLQNQIKDISGVDNPVITLKKNAERQAAEASIAKNDVREQELLRALATAQMTGGDVTGAKSALDNYLTQKNQARYEELAKLSQSDNTAIDAARKAYEQAQKTGDVSAITETAKALARVTEVAKQHTDEMAKIASGAYKPASAPATEIARGTANGTFNAYGIGGIMQQTIEKEQLSELQEIARNTRNFNKAIVVE